MIKSAEQLLKYKKFLVALNKQFPKGKTNWMGFTLDISYGGNKQINLNRLVVGGVASKKELGDEFLELILDSVQDNINFWEKAVLQDIKMLNEAITTK